MPRPRTRPRYRVTACSLWADSAFLAFSADSKLLYLALTTGLHTTSIPGCWCVWPEAIMHQLRWPAQRFRRAFAELATADFARWDFGAGVLFIGRVLDVDPPDSPSAVLGWRSAWAELPASRLKVQAWEAIRRHCEARGGNFVQAFAATCGSAPPTVGDTVSSTVTPHSDGPQEPEPEPEPEVPPVTPLRSRFERFWAAYPRKVGKKAAWSNLETPQARGRPRGPNAGGHHPSVRDARLAEGVGAYRVRM